MGDMGLHPESPSASRSPRVLATGKGQAPIPRSLNACLKKSKDYIWGISSHASIISVLSVSGTQGLGLWFIHYNSFLVGVKNMFVID